MTSVLRKMIQPRTVILATFIALSFLGTAKPSAEDISNLLSREKNKTLQDCYYFNELYKECASVNEVLELSKLLKSEFNTANQQKRNNIATAKRLSNLGKHRQAIEYLKTIRKKSFAQLDASIRSEYYHALGSIAMNSGNPKISLEYYQKAANISKSTKNKELFQSHLSAIGVAHNANKNPDQAMVYFKKALQLEISGENRNSLYIRLNIALTELNLGQLEKAKKGFTGALTLIRAKEDAYAEIRTLGNLGDIYVKQDSVELAISYLNKATDLAISNNQMMDLIRMHSSMSQAYEQKGDTKEALRLLKKAHSIESEMNQGISETLTENEFRQEIQVYELENNKIKTQRDHEVRLKWMLLFALILTGSITCLLLVYILRSARQKRQLLKHELRDTKLPIPAENNQFKEIIDQLELLVIEQELFKQTGLTLDQIAKLIGTNRSYLSEAINTHYQKSFTQWLGSIRIQSAKEQLTNSKYGHLSIEGISKNAGFSSISTFNSHFKNETGLTPSYFRKNAVN